MNQQLQLAKAIAIVASAFEGKLDKGGQPYIFHCLWVMDAVGLDDPELAQIAILHDLIEDTDWTLEGLMDAGFSNRVVKAVSILTHNKEDDYLTVYIPRIGTNLDCIRVKKQDLTHNTMITRLKGLEKTDHERIEKYHRAFVYLHQVEEVRKIVLN